jgi:hypothetical protein
MLHRSKKDGWLVGLVWGGALAPLAAGLFLVLARGGDPGPGWALVRAPSTSRPWTRRPSCATSPTPRRGSKCGATASYGRRSLSSAGAKFFGRIF